MTTYVIHCNICCRCIEKELKNQGVKCPPERPPVLLAPGYAGYDGGYERRRYPFYDECLNMWHESKQSHMREIKKRDLVQIDGFFTKGGVKREKRGVVYSFPKHLR